MNFSKRVRTRIVWIPVRKYQNIELAEFSVNNEGMWIRIAELVNHAGLKRYYKCKDVNDTGESCGAKLCVVIDSDTKEATLYKSDKHNHTNEKTEIAKIKTPVKEFIRNLQAQNLNAKDIYKRLMERNDLKIPTYNQVVLYIDVLQREIKDVVIDLRMLENWLQIHSTTLKEEHKAFVISHQVLHNKNTFYAVISTKHLFKLAVDAEVYHLATMQKLAWSNLPAFVLGATDKKGKFHAICIILCGSLNYYTFKLIFFNMRTKVKELFCKEMRPVVIVSDSEAVQDAFADVFQVKTRTCWRYAQKQIVNQLKWSIRSPRQLMKDLNVLRSVTCPSIFDAASELFLEKYDHLTTFIAYFKEKWLVNDRKWFLGAARPSIQTNFALLKYIKQIKDTYDEKLCLSLQLPHFLDVLINVINEISTGYAADKNIFVKTPEVTKKDWIIGNEWVKGAKTNILLVDDNYTHYEVTNGVQIDDDDDDNKWVSFDVFIKRHFSESRVSIPLNKQLWYLSKCNCPTFYKTYKCKHIIGLSMMTWPQFNEDCIEMEHDVNIL